MAIPFFMIPIITRLLPSPMYYGIAESNTLVVSFGSAIALVGMYDAMFRLFFDSEEMEYKKRVCSTALIATIVTSIFVIIIILLLNEYLAVLFFGSNNLSHVIMIAAFSVFFKTISTIVGAPTRMLNNRRIFLSVNVVSSLIAYGVAIVLIMNGYYVTALPLGDFVAVSCICISFFFLNKKWFSFIFFSIDILKEILKIGIPILPIFLIYWVYNSVDRLMITSILGIEYTGVYSVAIKLGHLSQLIYVAFAGGWQYFAFKTMREANQVENNSAIFEYLAVVSFSATAFMCCLSKILFDNLFTTDYSSAYIVAPYFFLAPLLLMLYQVNGNQFLVVKKTWIGLCVLTFGALINVLLNSILIPRNGIEGAAIATMLGYIVSVVVCSIVVWRMNLFIINRRMLICSLLFTVYFVSWRTIAYDKIILSLSLVVTLYVIYSYMYKNDINKLFKALRR